MSRYGLTGAGKRHFARKGLVFQLFLLALLGCTLPGQRPDVLPLPSPAATVILPTPLPPISELGTAKDPIIVALPPSGQLSPEVEAAGNKLIGLLEKSTRYHVVAVLPASESDLVRGFGTGNAHIGVLSPFAYLLASDEGNAEAAFAREQSGDIFYGAQFIARVDTGFTPYYDTLAGANSADSPVALSQFQDKKPCWSDGRSPSGYVVPLGLIKQAQVVLRQPAAFVGGQVAVVRAIDVGGICDFGATYIDARNYPGLEDQYPDLMKTVQVIWRIPAIIPYETLVFVHGMPEEIRRNLTRAFVDLMTTADGQSAMQTLYGFQAMQVSQDGQYDEFRKIVKSSELDLNELIK